MAKKTDKKKSVGEEAEGLIRGARQKEYGPPNLNFQRIADAWNGYLKGRDLEKEPITPADVANLMILLKTIRSAEGYKRDTNVDIIGYALLDAILEGDDEL